MRRNLLIGLLFFSLLCGSVAAALTFPALTGRVVDDAHILSGTAVAQLDQMLENYECGTTNQVVVVTIPSLQGTSIEDYGYQLGRAWGIGQKDKNNGVLLIVAPTEHKARIEVGYGLEGVLTDALSSEIMQGIIVPQFRTGHMEKGIVDGAQAIVDVLGGKSLPPTYRKNQGSPLELILPFLIFLFVFARVGGAFGWLPFLGLMALNSGARYGSGAGFGGGGGFSGGGGSFGGGGASGSW